MGVYSLPGNPEISVKIRRNARARRLTLRLARVGGGVTLTVPRGVSDREALSFAKEKRDWILEHLSQQGADLLPKPGVVLSVGGEEVELVAGGARLRFVDGQLHIPDDPIKAARQVERWLKEQARASLTTASDHYARALGRPYSRITLRDPRSRWGSCSSAGALMYSWRLILAPPEVLTYVAAHEVGHLQEMNHSAAFWAIVERLYGDTRPPRQWLRAHGADLHRLRLEA